MQIILTAVAVCLVVAVATAIFGSDKCSRRAMNVLCELTSVLNKDVNR